MQSPLRFIIVASLALALLSVAFAQERREAVRFHEANRHIPGERGGGGGDQTKMSVFATESFIIYATWMRRLQRQYLR